MSARRWLWLGVALVGIFPLPRLRAETPEGELPALQVVKLPLNDDEVTRIPTHPSVTVFIQFPSPITDYSGRGFTEDPQQNAGEFVLRHIDGDNYLTISPLTDTARRTLHVVVGGKGYPLQFFPAGPDEAWDKVTFIADAPTASAAAAPKTARDPEVKRSESPPRAHGFERPGTARLLGVIDTLRMLANLPEKQARRVAAANPALSLSIQNQRQDYERFSLTTHFVIRNQLLDALGFAVTLENTSRERIDFAPDSFMVRAGDHLYAALAADFDPQLAPGAKTTVFFVVVGDGTGGFNRLSVDNGFRVSVDVVSASGAKNATPPAAPRAGEKTDGR